MTFLLEIEGHNEYIALPYRITLLSALLKGSFDNEATALLWADGVVDRVQSK
jgi:hypothetical protein